MRFRCQQKKNTRGLIVDHWRIKDENRTVTDNSHAMKRRHRCSNGDKSSSGKKMKHKARTGRWSSIRKSNLSDLYRRSAVRLQTFSKLGAYVLDCSTNFGPSMLTQTGYIANCRQKFNSPLNHDRSDASLSLCRDSICTLRISSTLSVPAGASLL